MYTFLQQMGGWSCPLGSEDYENLCHDFHQFQEKFNEKTRGHKKNFPCYPKLIQDLLGERHIYWKYNVV
jgi:hypothetical protein